MHASIEGKCCPDLQAPKLKKPHKRMRAEHLRNVLSDVCATGSSSCMQTLLGFLVVKRPPKTSASFSPFGNERFSFVNAMICESVWSQVTYRNRL